MERTAGMIPGRRFLRVLLALCLAAPAVPLQAADDATLRKDLGAVIALLGLPCGQVLSALRQTENDHIAMCENGMRYRVYVNPAGRVVADKR